MSRLQIEYNPLPYQDKFHRSKKSKVYLSAGYGAGKTYSLMMHLFILMMRNPGLPGGILCPSIKMFKRDILPTIEEICLDNRIPYRLHKTDLTFFFPLTQSRIYIFHAEDHGRSIKGPNLAFGLINEVTLCSKGSFNVFLSRIRMKKAKFKQLAMSGTPESFNWVYEYFIEEPRDDTDVIFGNVRQNTYISDDYVQTLIDSY